MHCLIQAMFAGITGVVGRWN